MQTFLPYSSFIRSAEVLDNKRLGKQRLEAKQILQINLFRTCDDFEWVFCRDCKRIFYHPGNLNLHCKFCGGSNWTGRGKTNTTVKIPWENHPAVLMWRGHELFLALYGICICAEWISRGFKDNQQEFFGDIFDSDIKSTPWVGCQKLHDSHKSNLLRKNPKYYSKFGWEVPDNLPYYWPVRKK